MSVNRIMRHEIFYDTWEKNYSKIEMTFHNSKIINALFIIILIGQDNQSKGKRCY